MKVGTDSLRMLAKVRLARGIDNMPLEKMFDKEIVDAADETTIRRMELVQLEMSYRISA